MDYRVNERDQKEENRWRANDLTTYEMRETNKNRTNFGDYGFLGFVIILLLDLIG